MLNETRRVEMVDSVGCMILIGEHEKHLVLVHEMDLK